MSKRAILYSRVSSDEQAERGTSLQSQMEAMRAYAVQHGLTVVAELREDYTGAKLNRPALDTARGMLADHEADAIVVFSPDRLTRNLAHSLILREEWVRDGVELHYCNRGKSENTPESRMTENVEAVFAEYWREKIIEGNWRGRRQKAANGKWVGNGDPPYGYCKTKKGRDAALEIDEANAAVVQRIFAMYIGVNGYKPMSLA